MYNYLYWVSLCKPLRIISLNSVKLAIYLILLFFSHSVMFDSLPPFGLQHARLPCPSPSPGACSILSPLSQWWHPTISSSVIPFSCLQTFPASASVNLSHCLLLNTRIITLFLVFKISNPYFQMCLGNYI